MHEEEHVRVNRDGWDRVADEYQQLHETQIGAQALTGDITWGLWAIPESRLNVLGDVEGKDVLEVGCGAAQWSMAIARRGARPIGLDLSGRQLAHARRLMNATEISFPLLQASAERVPMRDSSFDVVFADHGAFSFADPSRTIPEAVRVLRRGGLLAFSHVSPFYAIATPVEADHAGDRLVYDYFGLRRLEEPDGIINFNLPYGEWIRLFRECGLVVEDLIEPRPEAGAESTYRDAKDVSWSRRWPSECIWRARKA
jgi:ubiquinone/menaquinone biosynthesis C-methylase UbiE